MSLRHWEAVTHPKLWQLSSNFYTFMDKCKRRAVKSWLMRMQ